jgi:hypothetical protein
MEAMTGNPEPSDDDDGTDEEFLTESLGFASPPDWGALTPELQARLLHTRPPKLLCLEEP